MGTNRSPEAAKQRVLDLDATDDPVHGEQAGGFFHGYDDEPCFLPLYVFCGSHLAGGASAGDVK